MSLGEILEPSNLEKSYEEVFSPLVVSDNQRLIEINYWTT